MPHYSDKDLEAFDQLARFGRSGAETLIELSPGVQPVLAASVSYSLGDVEQFKQLMQFDGATDRAVKPASLISASPSLVLGLRRMGTEATAEQGAFQYSDSDLAQFERLMMPSSFGLFQPPSTSGKSPENADAEPSGGYTSSDLEAFDTLMSLDPGIEIVDQRSAELPQREPVTLQAGSVPVPVRTSIKIVDSDAERARERHGYMSGGMKIKIVYSDAGG